MNLMSDTEKHTPDEVIDPETLEHRLQAKKIVAMIYAGNTWGDIADTMGIDRSTLYARVRGDDMRELLMMEVNCLETTLLDKLDEMLNHKSVVMQKTAVQEMGKMIRHSKDKLFPNLLRSENINLNIDQEKLKGEFALYKINLVETLNRLPPATRTMFWKTWVTVNNENNSTKPPEPTQHREPTCTNYPYTDRSKDKILKE